MILILSLIVTVLIAVFFAKKFFIITLRHKYERSLINGNREKSNQLGKIYYHCLDEKKRKEKGIIDIESKISDDFRSFNSRRVYLMF